MAHAAVYPRKKSELISRRARRDILTRDPGVERYFEPAAPMSK
jgi:hypothetical protein